MDFYPPEKLTKIGSLLYGSKEVYTPEGVSGDFKYCIPPGTVKYSLIVTTNGKDAYADIRVGAEYGTLNAISYDKLVDPAYKRNLVGYTIQQAASADRVCTCVNNQITIIEHDAGTVET